MPLTNFWPGLATNKTAGGDKQLKYSYMGIMLESRQ